MSRIGIQPVKIEDGVTVSINGNDVIVKGALGEQTVSLPSVLKAEIKDGEVWVTRSDEEKQTKSLHGTFRMLIVNSINGVKNGFTKKLGLSGVGYRVKKEGNAISMSLGFNHPVVMPIPEGLTADVPDEITIIVKGIDKQKVGQFASKIREKRKPEPYKGKGISFEGEVIKRKSAKSAATKK